VLSRHEFDSTTNARMVVIDWCYRFYNHQRRHSLSGDRNRVKSPTAATIGVLRLRRLARDGGEPVPAAVLVRSVRATLGLRTADLIRRLRELGG
jgi:hypothetical protein